ncbi:hypothetical protein [Devosia sp. MC521]|uniref:hypothetical protein n=1 Tax=Devosia sp. MC521 TaxID=2759954 RepID=UPI0015FE1C8E|nr:hypothetical protein [Devosia sp. MC521]MBJ6985919.1 hypothetical protein [Devosia sp. MC521]QMW61296.1 hypothetical protein H4N61_09840 [Devosia sp. MC521]
MRQPSRHQAQAAPDFNQLIDERAAVAAAAEAALIDRLAEIIAAHDSDEARLAAIEEAWPNLPTGPLKALIARALVVAQLTGRLNV